PRRHYRLSTRDMTDDDIMVADSPPPRLRWVVILLYIGLALMVGAIIVTLISAIGFITSPEFGDQLFEGTDAAARPSSRSLAIASLGSAVTAAAWFVVLRMLLKIVRSVQAGDPFRETNIGRLRWMWIIIAVTEVFRMVIYSIADIVMGPGEISQMDSGIDINLGTWFLVAIIAVLSEAFRKGVELRRDQELTI
ncbi:MAG: DUF2975 domain-containing protein, partial [Pseudomonadota bacterium]